MLYKLVAQTGGGEAQKLFDTARKSYFNKQNKSSTEPNKENEGPTDSKGNAEETENDIRNPSIKIAPAVADNTETTCF